MAYSKKDKPISIRLPEKTKRLIDTEADRNTRTFQQELADVLKNIGNQTGVDRIVAGAVARWKSGWGKRKGGLHGNKA